MKKSLKVLVLMYCMIASCGVVCSADNTAESGGAVKKIVAEQQHTTIQQVLPSADVYGDGEKVSSIALKYPSAIAQDSLYNDSFVVPGRTIDSVYTNTTPAPSVKSGNGDYVIIQLKQENTVSFDALKPRKADDQKAKSGPGDAPMISDRKSPDLSIGIMQQKAIKDINGRTYEATKTILKGTAPQAAAINAFQQYTYTDPASGYKMPYNIYLPKGYDGSKSYPLVVFIADASANNDDVTTPLYQGNGAVVWASDKWQAEHPCIVLAPQYTKNLVTSIGMMTTDKNVWTPGLQLTTNLIKHIINSYAVDKSRIYGTGQSQGGMANIAISDRHPGLFAAQFLVACQWNTEEMKILKDKNMWILVCEGDNKAYPAMCDATAKWEALGSPVARSSMWDSKAGINYLNDEARKMAAQGKHINFSVFQGGNHMYTWSVAYNIDAIRQWIFQQKQ